MSISPVNLLKHEIVGLSTHIVRSRDPSHISREGTVVAETRDMLQIDTSFGDILIAKDLCVFDFTLPDGTVVRVDGELLRGRSEDRLKKRQSRRW